jgi:hypothetical protein
VSKNLKDLGPVSEMNLPNGAINIFKDYSGNFIVGVQRGSDHQPLIRVFYPLILNYTICGKPCFHLYDSVVMPKEIRIKVVGLYKANDFIIDNYKTSCSRLYLTAPELELLEEYDHEH